MFLGGRRAATQTRDQDATAAPNRLEQPAKGTEHVTDQPVPGDGWRVAQRDPGSWAALNLGPECSYNQVKSVVLFKPAGCFWFIWNDRIYLNSAAGPEKSRPVQPGGAGSAPAGGSRSPGWAASCSSGGCPAEQPVLRHVTPFCQILRGRREKGKLVDDGGMSSEKRSQNR